MIEIGRLILKTAGRDAGKYGLIIDVIDENYVMIDGQVRRKKVNIKHIEPLLPVLKINKNASHEEVVSALERMGVSVEQRKPREKKPKPVKKRTLKALKAGETKKAEEQKKEEKGKKE